MRILLAGAAAASFAFIATPAFAQYGGSPADQVEGAPDEVAPGDEADEADEMVMTEESPDESAPNEAGVQAGLEPDSGTEADLAEAGSMDGKPADAGGEEFASVDVDMDMDRDVDADVDADMDADADPGAGEPVNGDEALEAPGEDGAPAADGGTWQGEDGRAYCRRSDGTTGLVVGGGAGALVGRGNDGGRRRGTGPIIGAIAGALIGTAVERSANQQSCR